MPASKRKRSIATEAAPATPPRAASPHPDYTAYVTSSSELSDIEYDGASGVVYGGAALVADCPFKIQYAPMSKKRRAMIRNKLTLDLTTTATTATATTAGLDGEEDPVLKKSHPEDNTTVYEVTPRGQWEELTKYRNFVVSTETFSINDHIFVNHAQVPHGVELNAIDDNKFWVAIVLEIRAIDEQHVYLRVHWFYWPDELPMGRLPYHGRRELIASNHLEIIDAMTVSGRANVTCWQELDDDDDMPDLYFRQKFDVPSQSLSSVRQHCQCQKPYNPDNTMFFCQSCRVWLHEECIVDSIKSRVIAGDLAPSPSEEATPTPPEPAPAVAPTKASAKTNGRTGSFFATVLKEYKPLKKPAEAPLPATPMLENYADGSKEMPSGESLSKEALKPTKKAGTTKAAKTKAAEMALIEVEVLGEEEGQEDEGKESHARITDWRGCKPLPEVEVKGKKSRTPRGNTKNKKMEEETNYNKEPVVWEITVHCLICDNVMT